MKAFPLYLLLLLALLGCRREDDPKASDPQPLGPVSAMFRTVISVRPGNGEPIYLLEADTLIGPTRVTMQPLGHTDDSLVWQIGSEPSKRVGRSISVLFDNPYEGFVDITCFAFRRNCPVESVQTCSDTFTRRIQILPDVYHLNYKYSHAFLGRFVGTSTQYPSLEYEVVLGVDSVEGMPYELFIQNLLPTCTNRVKVGSALVNQFYIRSESSGNRNCNLSFYDRETTKVAPKGMYNPQTGEISIRYWAAASRETYGFGEEFVFYGRRK